MEFSADTKSLAEAVDQVQEAVEKKSTIPILSHVIDLGFLDSKPAGRGRGQIRDTRQG